MHDRGWRLLGRWGFGAGALLALALVACAGREPPRLPAEPPDVTGVVATVQGSFAGGGTIAVRPADAGASASPDQLQLRPATRLVEWRKGELHWGNLARVQPGDHIRAWWDGQPTTSTRPFTGAVRLVVIERE